MNKTDRILPKRSKFYPSLAVESYGNKNTIRQSSWILLHFWARKSQLDFLRGLWTGNFLNTQEGSQLDGKGCWLEERDRWAAGHQKDIGPAEGRGTPWFLQFLSNQKPSLPSPWVVRLPTVEKIISGTRSQTFSFADKKLRKIAFQISKTLDISFWHFTPCVDMYKWRFFMIKTWLLF